MTATTPPPPSDPLAGTPDPASEVMTVRCTEDVLALVPHLLGFQPQESVVMATFGSRRGAFHARVDLPVGRSAREQAVHVLRTAVERNQPKQVLVLAYTDDSDAAFRLCRTLVPALQRAGADVIDAVRVDDRHWWDAMDRDAVPVRYDVSTHPFALQRILAGSHVLASREEVAATLDGTDPEATERLAAACRRLGELPPTPESAVWLLGWVETGLAQWARRDAEGPERGAGREGPEPVVEDETARALCLVRHEEMRLVVWTLLTRASAAGMVELWRPLVRLAPTEMRSGVAALVALAAWLAGDGALAWCAIERSLRADPSTIDAQTVAGLLQEAVAPDVWVPPERADIPLLRLAEAS